MFIFGYLFIALAKILAFVLNLYIFIIIVDTVLSWIRINNYNEYTRIISNLVEPYLSIIRNFVPRVTGIDFSPLIGILILYFFDEFVINVIRRIGESLI